jgi:hypothetical protein
MTSPPPIPNSPEAIPATTPVSKNAHHAPVTINYSSKTMIFGFLVFSHIVLRT